MTIKAIETRYAGYRFRSRLEARWAVFFDAAEIPWRYEPEGFETSAGWYLPDFELDIAHPAGWRIFAEVKGAPLRQDEADRIAALVSDDLDAKFAVIPLGDIPDPREHSDFHSFHAWFAGGFGRIGGRGPLEFVAPFDGPIEARRMSAQFKGGFGSCPPQLGDPGTPLQKALIAARSARFEHGETPR